MKRLSRILSIKVRWATLGLLFVALFCWKFFGMGQAHADDGLVFSVKKSGWNSPTYTLYRVNKYSHSLTVIDTPSVGVYSATSGAVAFTNFGSPASHVGYWNPSQGATYHAVSGERGDMNVPEEVALSDNGRVLAYAFAPRTRSLAHDVYIRTPNGTPENVTHSGKDNESEPSLSGNGRYLLYTHGASNGSYIANGLPPGVIYKSEIVCLDLKTRRRWVVAPWRSGGCSSPFFLPGDKEFLYLQNETLYKVRLDGSHIRKLLKIPGVWDIHLSRSGRSLLFTASLRSLGLGSYYAHVTGSGVSAPVRITDPPNTIWTQWNICGDRAVYARLTKRWFLNWIELTCVNMETGRTTVDYFRE